MMDEILRDWLDRKLRHYLRLKQEARVKELFKKQTNHGHFAGVTLSARPAERFSFTSQVTWPEGAYVPWGEMKVPYELYVLDGILDVLCGRAMPVLGAAFVLEAIEFDPAKSVAMAFYCAAKEATTKILQGNVGLLKGNASE